MNELSEEQEDCNYNERIAEIQSMLPEVKPQEKVVFDAIEQQIVYEESEERRDLLGTFQNVPKDIRQSILGDFVAKKLLRTARWRLTTGDFKGAKSSCIKALGLFPFYDMDWLLFAEILAEQQDVIRAKTVIAYARNLHKTHGTTKFMKEAWDKELHRVQDIVKSKGQ